MERFSERIQNEIELILKGQLNHDVAKLDMVEVEWEGMILNFASNARISEVRGPIKGKLSPIITTQEVNIYHVLAKVWADLCPHWCVSDYSGSEFRMIENYLRDSNDIPAIPQLILPVEKGELFIKTLLEAYGTHLFYKKFKDLGPCWKGLKSQNPTLVEIIESISSLLPKLFGEDQVKLLHIFDGQIFLQVERNGIFEEVVMRVLKQVLSLDLRLNSLKLVAE